MMSTQFFQSLLRISMEIGDPSDSPARTPERNSMRSVSICMRRPRPYPLLSAREIGVDVGSEQWRPSGEPLENGHQSWAVRFAGGRETER